MQAVFSFFVVNTTYTAALIGLARACSHSPAPEETDGKGINIYTHGEMLPAHAYPEMRHIGSDKDFTPVIEKALELGTVEGLPRLMDMGQCNDAYGAIRVAAELAKAFDCDVNELPLSMILSWYEQKAVCILLTLLHLGIKNIRLGPTLPAFISPHVLAFLTQQYGIAPIRTPEEDLREILGD